MPVSVTPSAAHILRIVPRYDGARPTLVAAGDRIDSAIGGTPMVRLTEVVEPGMAEVWIKLEGLQPAGSIKDRTALGMILDAEQRGFRGHASTAA